jgi:cobyrinic acid a,c-diamide synthase
MKGFVIAGTGTGVGKTTVTAALLAALRARGLTVQPFKCGPDYIDPAHHSALAGRPSYNLDTWMMPAETNRRIFRNAMHMTDVAVVEGVMGLFDGVNGTSDEGSTAEIAKLLGLPVVLVVDASSVARSVAALVMGFRDFDPQLRIAGVILNGAAGPLHVKLLRESIAPIGVPVLGWFPRLPELALRERHLGLVTAGERTWNSEQVSQLAGAAEAHIEIDRLLASCDIFAGEVPETVLAEKFREQTPVLIGVAKDRAFSFYYESSLDALRAAGAELVEVSPLSDTSLPSSLDGLYLGGGYPEVYAEELSRNHGFLESLREFVSSCRPVYAECGGLMYLAEELKTLDGCNHRLASVLPLSIEMLDRLEGFGYTEVELLEDSLVGTRGARLRGHSFHYSHVTREGAINRRYRTRRSLGNSEEREGFSAGNVLASYIHLSFAANPEAAEQFVQHCRQSKAVAR